MIGNINVAGVDMLSIIKEYNLPYEFPKQVLEEARSVEKEINISDIKIAIIILPIFNFLFFLFLFISTT